MNKDEYDNMTPAELEEQMRKQGFRCTLCNGALLEPSLMEFHKLGFAYVVEDVGDVDVRVVGLKQVVTVKRNPIDHCHVRKKKRDVLHHRCNKQLGFFEQGILGKVSHDLLPLCHAYSVKHGSKLVAPHLSQVAVESLDESLEPAAATATCPRTGQIIYALPSQDPSKVKVTMRYQDKELVVYRPAPIPDNQNHTFDVSGGIEHLPLPPPKKKKKKKKKKKQKKPTKLVVVVAHQVMSVEMSPVRRHFECGSDACFGCCFESVTCSDRFYH